MTEFADDGVSNSDGIVGLNAFLEEVPKEELRETGVDGKCLITLTLPGQRRVPH